MSTLLIIGLVLMALALVLKVGFGAMDNLKGGLNRHRRVYFETPTGR